MKSNINYKHRDEHPIISKLSNLWSAVKTKICLRCAIPVVRFNYMVR